MNLYDSLAENKLVIAQKWLESVLATYHPDGAKFFKKQQDRFANPLGYSARVGLEKLVYSLASGKEVEIPSEFLQFLKLRAVQKFTPTEALSFIYDLKGIIVKCCSQRLIAENLSEWFELDAKLDKIVLNVFEMYAADRERLYTVTLQEYKSGNSIAVRGGCPSGTMMKKQNEEKDELKVIRET